MEEWVSGGVGEWGDAADGNTEMTEVHGDREIDGELCASAPPV